MATVDSYETVKGTVGENLAFDFDIANDVLYLRFISTEEREVFGEETPDGFLLFRTDDLMLRNACHGMPATECLPRNACHAMPATG